MPHTDVFVVIDHEQRVLLVEGRLPQHTGAFHFWQACAEANHALSAEFGVDAVTVRVTQTQWGDTETRFTYLMQYRGGDLPPNAAWTPADQSPEAAQSALAWLHDFHPHRVPWYRLDFMDNISQIMCERFGTDTRLEQVRSWGRSSIWRLRISETTAYLKVVPPMFVHEPQFSALLAQEMLQFVPMVRAYERDKWFVMADYGGDSLFAEHKRHIELWERALREYARFQQRTASLGIESGLPIRDVAWISEGWRALLSDESALNRGSRPISAYEKHQIADNLSKLEEALDVLRADKLTTLTHGDFWAGQIVQTADDRLLFTDWSDAALAHPFFDLAFFLAEIEADLLDSPNAKARLIDAYLSEWGEVQKHERYAACELVAPLYTALRYHHDILPHMEIAWEMENMLAYNLRLMLKALTER